MQRILRVLSPSVWRTPEGMLILLAAAMALAFSTWQALLNNFAINEAAFTGREIGILQSLREIPGFMAFSAVFFLLFIREQTFALIALALLGIGVAITGYFPTEYGLFATTVLMSAGFHYYETMQQSLTLQWMSKERAPVAMGRQISARSISSLIVFGFVWLAFELLGLSFQSVYLIGGIASLAIVLFCATAFPRYEGEHVQHKKMVLRKRYWLYYALVFMGGARRQIFVVFAGFMMVEKFGYDPAQISLLFLFNYVASIWLGPRIGRLINKWGERNALIFEYVGLILVFTGYAVVNTSWMAAGLYIVDHLFFAFAIAQRSYLQKIADPRDMASTAGVSFSINHIAAVGIPVIFGLIWMKDSAIVFLLGTAMAVISLILALNVPRHPEPGNETVVGRVSPAPVAAGD